MEHQRQLEAVNESEIMDLTKSINTKDMGLFTLVLGFIREDAIIIISLHLSLIKETAFNAKARYWHSVERIVERI